MPKFDNISSHEVNYFYTYILQSAGTNADNVASECLDAERYVGLSVYLNVFFNVGPITSGGLILQLTHSDTINAVDFEDIPSEYGFDQNGNPTTSITYDATSNPDTFLKRLPLINLVNTKRYVSIRAYNSITPDNDAFLSLVSLGTLKVAPSNLAPYAGALVTKQA